MLKVKHKRLSTLAFLLGALLVPQIHAQTCIDAIPASTPTSDFEVHNDGTVTHTPTRLMWKVCSEGQTWQSSDGSCSGLASDHSWQQALQAPKTLNDGGGYPGVGYSTRYTDWRLPNAKELASIFEFKCHSPAINLTVFNNTRAGDSIRSSSLDADSRLPFLYAMIFFIDDGSWFSFDRVSSGLQKVRLVRNAE